MVYTGQDLGLSGGFGDPFGIYPTFGSTRITTAAAGAAPTLVTVTDDDAALNVESPTNNQLLSSAIDMDGTVIGPAGTSVTILGTSVVVNATTLETGVLAIVQINNVNGVAGNNIAIGYATTIDISPGDQLTIMPWKNSPRSVNYDDLIGAPVCFAAGSLVQCPEGWRAIETLHAGDRVCTRTGPPPFALPPAAWGRMRRCCCHPTIVCCSRVIWRSFCSTPRISGCASPIYVMIAA